jgi:hypothetical protein
MRLIDVDDVEGVRAAVTTFTSEVSSLRFVLVPLAILAEPAHYEAVREIQRSCDLVLIGSGTTSHGRPAGQLDPEFYGRIGRGPHIQLSVPPPRWEGVDRPFIKAPVADADATPSGGRQRVRMPWSIAATVRLQPLAAWGIARFITRVEVAWTLASQAGLALGPGPRGRGPLYNADRYGESVRRLSREQLTETARRIHRERQGDTLRIAVVDWADALPTVARGLGALGYAPTEIDWIIVFSWLPGEAPTGESPGWLERRMRGYAGQP